MDANEQKARVIEEARGWPEARIEDLAGGVTGILAGTGVLARIHDDGRVEIPFPRSVGEQLVAEGKAERHTALPDSGWVEFRLGATGDAEALIDLLRLARDARRPGASGAAKPLQHVQEIVDESVDESFPASDPPARGRA